MTAISERLMVQVSQYLAENLGWHFPPERWRDLERGLKEIARTRHFETVEACIDWILTGAADKERTNALAIQFTVGETYFNRELQSLEALEQHVLPELIRGRRGKDQRLKIWSAGCCTGEEPYSIAILLDRMIPDLGGWNIKILGTDINPYFLEKARAGIYSQWSFRGAPAGIRDSYFCQGPDRRLEILPRIKQMVRLEQLNLAETPPPALLKDLSCVDLILCRNVLIYFSQEGAARVLDGFYNSLSAGGWLVVSQTETSLVDTRCFATRNFPGAALFRRLESIHQMPERVGLEDISYPDPNRDISSQFESIEHLGSGEPEPAASPIMSDPTRTIDEALSAPARVQLTQDQELLLYREGRYKELGDALLEFALDADARVMALLAKVFANQGRYHEALDWIERAIAIDKLDAGSRYLQATILQEQSRFEDAMRSLNRAMYLEPDFVLAHFSLGNLLLKQGRRPEGKRSLATALTLLSACEKDDLLPESDGISAGRLTEIIISIISTEAA